MTSDDGVPAELVAFIVLGFVVAVVLALVFAVGWSSPSVVAGDVPEVSHAVSCDGTGQARCGPDTRIASLKWTLGRGGHTGTTLATTDDGRETITREIDGSLELDDPDDCPGAVVAWTLTPQRGPARTLPPLSAAQPETVSLDELAPPAAGALEFHLDLRRLDRQSCQAAVVWKSASFG